MLSMYGLRQLHQSNLSLFPKDAFSDVLSYVKEFHQDILQVLSFNHQYMKQPNFQQHDLHTFHTKVKEFEDILRSSSPNVSFATFTMAMEMAEQLQETKNSLLNFIFQYIETKPRQPLDKEFRMYTRNAKALHRLGFLHIDNGEGITVSEEMGDFYIGHLWDSHFVNVLFKKEDVRELTEDELKKTL